MLLSLPGWRPAGWTRMRRCRGVGSRQRWRLPSWPGRGAGGGLLEGTATEGRRDAGAHAAAAAQAAAAAPSFRGDVVPTPAGTACSGGGPPARPNRRAMKPHMAPCYLEGGERGCRGKKRVGWSTLHHSTHVLLHCFYSPARRTPEHGATDGVTRSPPRHTTAPHARALVDTSRRGDGAQPRQRWPTPRPLPGGAPNPRLTPPRPPLPSGPGPPTSWTSKRRVEACWAGGAKRAAATPAARTRPALRRPRPRPPHGRHAAGRLRRAAQQWRAQPRRRRQ